MTKGKQKRDESSPADHLPARRAQSTALLEAPKEGVKRAVEQGAQIYFSTCRRLAQWLNRHHD